MSRHAASRSPSHALYEAPPRRRSKCSTLHGRRMLDEDSFARDGLSPRLGPSHSRSPSLRPRMADSRARSRSRGLRPVYDADGMRHSAGMSTRSRRGQPWEDVARSPTPPPRSRRRRADAGPAERLNSSRVRHGDTRQGKDRKRRHRDHDRDRDRDDGWKLTETQQAQMRLAMMQGMGMMGVPHPALQAAMLQRMAMAGMPPPGFMPPGAAAAGFVGEGASGSSSSSSDSSSSETEGDTPALLQAIPGMPFGMWPGTPGAGPPAVATLGSTAEGVEHFLAQSPVDPDVADRLRALPPHMQQAVVRRGPISDTRNPTAVLISRMRDVELGRGDTNQGSTALGGNAPLNGDREPNTGRRSAKVTIDAMIRDYRLSPGCAWMLRALPPDKQKLAARIDPAGQADPSGYVAEQLKKIV